MSETIENQVEESSGNIFADLGLENADELHEKGLLLAKIYKIVRKRGYKQKEASKVMELTQPQVSNLMNARLDEFSIDRLIKCLKALGCRVDIKVIEHPRRNSWGDDGQQLAL